MHVSSLSPAVECHIEACRPADRLGLDLGLRPTAAEYIPDHKMASYAINFEIRLFQIFSFLVAMMQNIYYHLIHLDHL